MNLCDARVCARVLYATCALSLRENEHLVRRVTNDDPVQPADRGGSLPVVHDL